MGYNADAAVTPPGTRTMIEPDQWNSALSSVTGTLVRGTERVATKDVLAFLGLEEHETKRLAQAMRLHGWSGPKSMRFTDAAGRSVVASGYERKPGQSVAVVAPVGDVSGDLPSKLEAVTRLALREVGKVLKTPFDALGWRSYAQQGDSGRHCS